MGRRQRQRQTASRVICSAHEKRPSLVAGQPGRPPKSCYNATQKLSRCHNRQRQVRSVFMAWQTLGSITALEK